MVSVIIPTYNQAQQLPRAIESVWAQGIEDLEVIVVDDGSTDDTDVVLRELSNDGRLRCFRQQNLGPAAARNRGIRESRGELIAFLDSDDFWLPGKLQAELEALERTGCRFSYCGSQVVDENGDVLTSLPAADKDSLFSELIWGNRIATPTVLVHRSLLDEAGPFDESLHSGEDWDLWLRLSLRSRAACVPKPLVAVRGEQKWQADDLQFRGYEHTVNTVLPRLFSLAAEHENLASIVKKKRQVISWHFAVLAKSYLRHGDFLDSMRCAARSLTSSPRGLIYMIPARASV